MTTDKPAAERHYLDRLLARLAEATGDLCQQCDAKIQEAARLAFEDILKGYRSMTTTTDLTMERLDELEQAERERDALRVLVSEWREHAGDIHVETFADHCDPCEVFVGRVDEALAQSTDAGGAE